MKLQISRTIVFAFLAVLFLGICSARAETADEYFNEGLAYDKQGNWSQAISSYSNAIKINPKLTAAYFNRGNAYYNNSNYDQAISDYTQTIKDKPDLPQAYNNRAGAYINNGNDDQAIVDSSKAIELSPNYADAYNNRATAYYHEKKYDKTWADVHMVEKLGASVDPQFLEGLKKASEGDD